MSNSIADIAIRIKNGYMAGKPVIAATYSKLNVTILEILKKEKFIADYRILEDGVKKTMQIELRYTDLQPAVSEVALVSKPGRRMYSRAKYIRPVLGGLGISLLSTPKGVMTDRDARKLKVGGEVLFKIW